MLYNRIDRTLYTEDGRLIKQLVCPYKAQDLKLVRKDLKTVTCKNCDHSLLLAHAYPEEELLHMVRNQPGICLLVDFSSPSIKQVEGIR